MVRSFELAGGKSFELQFVPAVALEAQRDAATDPLQKSFAAMMHNLATGIQIDTASAHKAFPGIQLKSLKDHVSQAFAVAASA